MTGLGSVKCPRCLGPIRLKFVGTEAGTDKHTAVMLIRLDPFDVRRHALCYEPPPDGQPLPDLVAA